MEGRVSVSDLHRTVKGQTLGVLGAANVPPLRSRYLESASPTHCILGSTTILPHGTGVVKYAM